MSALVPLMTSTGPLLDRASAGVRALMNAVSRREGEYFEEGHFSAAQVKKELQDTNAEAKVRALKRLLAAHASGLDVSGLLPEVVKAIAVPSLEVKRLVYLLLILHAETSRDVALLSINSFQKDLADRNQVVRATALKALASIHLLEVVQLLMAALRRAAADSSPFVRRTAAQCVMKVYTLDPDQFQELQKIVLTLLKDVEISVVGAALVAFRELCLRHGAADCLRYHEAQLPPEQQQQQDAYYLHLCLEEQQQTQRRRQQSGSADASGDTARHGKETEEVGKEEVDEQQQQNPEMPGRTKMQGMWNDNNKGGCESEGVHAAAATDAESATPANSEIGGHPRVAGHVKTAAAGTKLRNLKAQACALALLHQHYRRLQESILQLEPFAQVVAVDLFLRYARLFFTKPETAWQRKQQQLKQEVQQQEPPRSSPLGREGSRGKVTGVSLSSRNATTTRNARGDVSCTVEDTLTYEKVIEESSSNPLPADLRMFLWNLGQLLYSESVAVVASVVAAFYHLLPAAAWKPVVLPLLRCIYTSSVEVQEPLLHIAATLAAAAPSLFLEHFRCFFLSYNDPPCVKQGKLLVLRRLLFSSRFVSAAAAREEGATLPRLLLQELSTYIRWPGDPLLLSTCFNFLVNIALHFPSGQSACMQIFVQLLDTPPSCKLASEAILGLQVLLRQQQEQQQQRPLQEGSGVAAAVDGSDIAEWTSKKASFREANIKKKQPGGRQQLGWLVLQLAMHLSRVVQGAAARASIVWIVGEYQREVGWVAADVFRQLASSFNAEPAEVKLQILLLGLKVWALHWDNKQRLKEHQQQQQSGFSAAQAGRESSMTAAAETMGTPPEAAYGTESSVKREEGDSDQVSLMQNGVLPAAAAAAKGATQVRNQQQQHEQTQELHAGVEEVQQKGKDATCKPRIEEIQLQDREEQPCLLPPPTPEESAAAFPRIDRMLTYVCEAASFDISYDVRDVARLYFALSRLALASEKRGSNNSGSSPTSRHNRSNTSSNDRSSSTPCNTIRNNTRDSNTEKSSDTHYAENNRRLPEGSTAATPAGEKEVDIPLVREGLAGCGGQMFKNASSQALADMSSFAQKYMRELVRGSEGGQRSDTPVQRNIKIQHPAGTLTSTAAAAGASSNNEKKCASAYNFTSETENLRDSNSMMLGVGPPSSRSGVSSAENGSSSSLWEEQQAPEECSSQSSGLLLASLSELLGERMRGYIDLPPFATKNSPDELRKVEQTTVLPELAQCLMRGSAAAAARGERNSVPPSHMYVDIQEVKAISSEDIVVKRSAAALMGRDTNVKTDFTPFDLDSFYADDLQSNGVAGSIPPVVQQVGDAPATASSFPAALISTGATSFTGNANSPLSLESNTFLASPSNTMSETFRIRQQEEHLQQQQNLWDMFGEVHAPQVNSTERTAHQMHQNLEDQSIAQSDGKAATDLLDPILVAGSGSLMADPVRERRGGVAVAGEDEESDEEKGFPGANA